MFRSLTMGRTPDVFNLSFGYREEEEIITTTTTTTDKQPTTKQQGEEEEQQQHSKEVKIQSHEVNVEYNSDYTTRRFWTK